MVRYLDTLSRHRVLLLAPIVLALAATIGITAALPRGYEASARIVVVGALVDVAPPGSPYGDLTPAEQEAGVLKSLLATRTFCVNVAHRGPLGSYLADGHGAGLLTRLKQLLGVSGRPPSAAAADDQAYSLLSQSVTVVATPPQVVTITFQVPDAQVAAGTVSAIVDEFSSETRAARRAQAEAVTTFLTKQVAEQDTVIANADAAVNQYLNAHPQQRAATAVTDVALDGLRHTADMARQQYQALLLQLDQARLDLAAQSQPGSPDFRVVDQPDPQPASLAKALLRASLTGLAGGLLVSLAGLLLLTAVDTSLRRPEDVGATLGLRVAGTIPRVG